MRDDGSADRRWEIYINRCFGVKLWRISRIPGGDRARSAAWRRFFLQAARTGQLPLKDLVRDALVFDEENFRTFLLRLGAEMKSKNFGKRWMYDDVDRAILQLWDGFDIIPAKRQSGGNVRLRDLPPLSRWNARAASKCIGFVLSSINIGVSKEAYAMRLLRLGLKPEKPAYISDAEFQRSPRTLSAHFSPSGAEWWRNQKQSKKCRMQN
jgi:hypothetical protein